MKHLNLCIAFLVVLGSIRSSAVPEAGSRRCRGESGAASVPAATRAYGEGALPILQPAQYGSPSGEFRFDVNPTSRYGAGPSTVRMLRGGQEIWSKKLPVTPWEVAVTDQGYVGAYAYSTGWRGLPRDGRFHVLVVSPDGQVLANLATARDGGTFHSPPNPLAAGLLASDELDLLIVRIRSPEHGIPEIWRSYRLTTGQEASPLAPPELTTLAEEDRAYVQEVRTVPGTPLLLPWWWYSGLADSRLLGYVADGAVFKLHDIAGHEVWSLDLPGDYTVVGDEQADDLLESRIRRRGAIRSVGPTSRFSVLSVRAGKRIDFEVRQRKEPQGGWHVERLAEEEMLPLADPEPKAPPAIDLEELGTVELKPESPLATSAVRDVQAIGFTDDGCVEFIRKKPERRVFTYVRLRPDGSLDFETPFASVDPEGSCSIGWYDAPGDHWYLFLHSWGEEGWRRLLRVNVREGTMTEVGGVNVPSLETMAPTLDGGLLAVVRYDQRSTSKGALIRYDADGQRMWVVWEDSNDPTKLWNPKGVVQARDGTIAVVGGKRKELQLYDAEGGHLRNIDLRASWGKTPRHPTKAWASPEGGVWVKDRNGLWQMDLEGNLLGAASPRMSEADAPSRIAARIAISPEGRIWCTDRTSIYRLDMEGIVDLTLGTASIAAVLQKPGAILVDHLGRVLVQDTRTGAVHVFDSAGGVLGVCSPAEGDFDEINANSCLAVDAGGRVFAARDNLSESGGFVKFESTGRRIGVVQLPSSNVALDSGSGGWWGEANYESTMRRWDENGAVQSTIDRRSDRHWIRNVADFTTTRDGGLMVLDAPRVMTQDGGAFLALFDKNGTGLKTVRLPEGVMAFSTLASCESWSVIGSWGSPRLLVRHRDGEIFLFNPGGPDNRDRWNHGFSPDEKELWSVEVQILKLHRFALPEDD